jgi:hypothetical protein
MQGRSFSSGPYRYGFNSQEQDNEIYGNGNSYTAEFWQYDSRLGRRWNVDPVVKQWESTYSCFSGNPVRYIDPLGLSAGDYYKQNGVKIGTDNKKDGRIYIVTDNKSIKNIKNNNGIVDENNKPSKDNYFELPSYENRQEIKAIMATLETTVYRELGGKGIIGIDGEVIHLRIKDGYPSGPYESKASIDFNKVDIDDYTAKVDNIPNQYTVDFTWHSHPNGFWLWEGTSEKWITFSEQFKQNISGQTIGQKTKGFIQTPSDHDLGLARLSTVSKNFVLSRANNRLYFYNGNNRSGKNFSGYFPLKLFYDIKSE